MEQSAALLPMSTFCVHQVLVLVGRGTVSTLLEERRARVARMCLRLQSAERRTGLDDARLYSLSDSGLISLKIHNYASEAAFISAFAFSVPPTISYFPFI